jgi:hypothetical protein
MVYIISHCQATAPNQTAAVIYTNGSDRLNFSLDRLTDALINLGLQLRDKAKGSSDWNPTLSPTCSMGKKVTCTCPDCLKHHIIIDGQQIPGNRISQQLRRTHELHAAANRSAEYSKPGNSKAHPVGVERFLDEEENVNRTSRGSSGMQYSCNLLTE